MHSRRRFALETVFSLQYRCPQSGTSYLHTAVAELRNGSWYKARGGSRQLRSLPLWAAHSFRLARSTANYRAAEPASSNSGCVECGQSAATMSRGTLPPRPARQQAHPSPSRTASDWSNRSRERRLRGPRPPTPESCLIVRSAGGWPADRTAFADRMPTGSARLSSSARTARSSVVRVDRPAIHPHHNHVAAPPLSANSADRVGPMPFPARRHRLRVFY